MACFDNFIEIDGTCSDVTPTSGLFLKDIGITADFIEQVITRQYSDVTDFANEKIAMARQVVFNRVINHFSPRLKAHTVLDGQRIGHTENDNKTVSGDGTRKGIEVELCNHDSFIDFYLSELSLHLKDAGAQTVEVWDILENRKLDDIVVTAVAGQTVTVYPNKTYKSDRKRLHLAFIYDSTGLDAVKTEVKQGHRQCCGAGQKVQMDRWITTRGVSVPAGQDVIKANLDGKSETAGMSLVYSLSCNYEDWMCQVRNIIALPILYQAGITIMEHALMVSPNDRVNTTVTINHDLIQERLDLYNRKFSEAMDNALKHMQPPSDRDCFVCNVQSKNTVILP